jgi:hypothetical protein
MALLFLDNVGVLPMSYPLEAACLRNVRLDLSTLTVSAAIGLSAPNRKISQTPTLKNVLPIAVNG